MRTRNMQDTWMNPKVLTNDTANYRDVMQSTDPELLSVGPARCGKTIVSLRKIFALHMKYRGFKSSIVRSNSVDLTDSIRDDIKFLRRYDFEDTRSPIKAEGGIKFDTLHINGGTCVLGGMNRPGKVLGTHKDLILYSQMEQCTNEQFQTLKSRVSGSAGNWKVDGEVKYQFIGDANPGRRDHFLLNREKSGKMRFIQFEFKDNPIFYRNGAWTAQGETFKKELDESLEGVYHDRLYKGEWSSMEGAVFEIHDYNLIDELPADITDYYIYNAIDFGMASPNVCLWIAEHPETEEVIVFREYRKTRQTIMDFGRNIRQIRKEHRDRILGTIIDNDENRQQILLKECNIPSQMIEKFPGSIDYGIDLIQNLLTSGKLKLYNGMRCNRDNDLAAKNQPLSLIEEMNGYHYPKEGNSYRKDVPVPIKDHGIDAFRYWCLWRFGRPTNIGFAGTSVHRKTRF